MPEFQLGDRVSVHGTDEALEGAVGEIYLIYPGTDGKQVCRIRMEDGNLHTVSVEHLTKLEGS